MRCPRCGNDTAPGARFCTRCGNPLANRPAGTAGAGGGGEPRPRETAPRVSRDADREPSRGGGCGCFRCGCLGLTVTVVVLALLVGLPLARQYRVTERLGIAQSSAERVLSGTPDRAAARAIKEELAGGGLDTRGVDVYVLPITGKETTMAYAVLDGGKGFSFRKEADPIIDFMRRLATGSAARDARVERVAVEYRSWMGESLAVFTAPADAVSAFALGTMTRKQLMEKLEGRADWQSFMMEVGQ